MVAAAIAAAELIPRLDGRLNGRYLPAITGRANANVVVSVLTSVATGMIAFTGFVFTIVLLAVQFGTSTLSARLIPFLQRDRVIRAALGTFTATFVYCVVAATVVVNRRGAPLVTALVAQLLALASVLLFFALLSRIVSLLHASALAHRIAGAGRAAIDVTHPQPYSPSTTAVTALEEAAPDGDAVAIVLRNEAEPGVLVHVDVERLARVARDGQTRLVVAPAPGDFVGRGDVLVTGHRELSPRARREVRRAIRVGAERRIGSDPASALRVLADIVVKSLPPVAHDPTTAVQVLDEIEDLLVRLAGRELGPEVRTDRDGTPLVVVRWPDWADYVSLGLDQARIHATGSLQVVRRLRATFVALLDRCPPERRPAVAARLDALDAAVDQALGSSFDRQLADVADRQGLGGARSAS